MKKFKKLKITGLTCVLFFASSLILRAQNGLSNLSFETWTTSVLGASPVGWFSSNVTEESSGAQHLNKFARLNQSTNKSGFMYLTTMETWEVQLLLTQQR